MNRPIKFRAWNPDNPNLTLRMVENPLHRCDSGNVLDRKESYKNWTLMQYTGLTDENGTEIYEGDLVRKLGGEPEEIEFFQGVFVVGEDMVDLGSCNNLVEVIGNKYE